MLKAAIAAGTLAGVLLLEPMVRAPARAAPPALQASDFESSAVTEVRKRHFGGRRHAHGHRHFRGRHFGGRRFFHGGRHFGHRKFHRRHFGFRRHYGGHIWVGRSCRWLRIRAIVTGSPYWWRRYHRCRYRWY